MRLVSRFRSNRVAVLLLCSFACILLFARWSFADEFSTDSIKNIMRKVSRYYLKTGMSGQGRTGTSLNNYWDGGAYMSGIMALYEATADKQYLDSAIKWGNAHSWEPGGEHGGVTTMHADDHCCCQTYCDLYLQNPVPANAAYFAKWETNLKYNIDQNPMSGISRWYWDDALYMAPPAYAKLYKCTNTLRYLDTLDKYWWSVSASYYAKPENLWFRDNNWFYPAHKTANGNKVLWSCGNAWVYAGLARVIPCMPATYPSRQKFIDQFKEMSVAIKAQQGADGLWTTSMLDHNEYPEPEASGTAFFAFGMAWGIISGILDKATYLPVIQSAWSGCVKNVASDGRLLRCQYMGWCPAGGFASTTTREGHGAFLLMGNELLKVLGPVAVRPKAETNKTYTAVPSSPETIIAFSGSRLSVPDRATGYCLYSLQGRQLTQNRIDIPRSQRSIDIAGTRSPGETVCVRFFTKE